MLRTLGLPAFLQPSRKTEAASGDVIATQSNWPCCSSSGSRSLRAAPAAAACQGPEALTSPGCLKAVHEYRRTGMIAPVRKARSRGRDDAGPVGPRGKGRCPPVGTGSVLDERQLDAADVVLLQSLDQLAVLALLPGGDHLRCSCLRPHARPFAACRQGGSLLRISRRGGGAKVVPKALPHLGSAGRPRSSLSTAARASCRFAWPGRGTTGAIAAQQRNGGRKVALRLR